MKAIAFIGVPTFRIRDVEAAKKFYVDRMGCQVDWEHYYAEGAPVYMQVSRDGLILHLSENERFPPKTIAFVESSGIEAFHRELVERACGAQLAPIERTPWKSLQLEIEDPFGNLLRFNQNPAAES